ncbi:MAG: amidohydrolase [Sporolactobacillus sp.]
MTFTTAEAALLTELTTYRHHLHAHPELSGHEVQTTDYIEKILQKWNIDIVPTTLPTGVIAEIGNRDKGPTIALRADIDALPINELAEVSYRSRNAGVMHACGHDVHTASLLGGAFLLNQSASDLPGCVRLIFQPAEEANEGALQVIRAGHLNGVAAIIGFHNRPQLAVGKIGIRAGAIAGAIDKFAVTLRGKGTHAAHPEAGVDPIVALTAVVSALQSIISRNVPPLHGAVLSVTELHAGNVWNVLPAEAVFSGTVRTLEAADRQLIHSRFSDIVTHTAAAYGVEADIDWQSGDPAVTNDQRLSAIVADECRRFADVFTNLPSLGSDDFACYQQLVPGVYATIGAGGSEGLHHGGYTADDRTLLYGALFFERNAKRLLREFADEGGVN